jgi:predicted DNA-binding antitoxin AbrB/MazE fold protein
MTKVVEAIFEDGVLKPLEALGLIERQHVEIVVRDVNGTKWPAPASNESERQAALRDLIEEVDRMNLRLRVRMPSREEFYDRL